MAKFDKKKLAEACEGLQDAVINQLCNENLPKKPEDWARLFETQAEKAIEENNRLLPAAFARTLKKETEALAKMFPNNKQKNEIMTEKKHTENQNTEIEVQKLKEDTEAMRRHYGMLIDHHIIDFDMFENKVGKENVPEILQEYNKILMKCELAEYEPDFIGICHHGKVDCALQESCLIGLKCNHEHEHSNAKMCYMNKQGGELETFLLKNNTSVPKLLEMEKTIAKTQQEEFAKNAFSAYDIQTPQPKPDERVNHPKHYQHPSGIECITVARHHDFNIGNALKYIWRAGLKQEQGISPTDKQIEDLQKAAFYIQDEIQFLKSKQQEQ